MKNIRSIDSTWDEDDVVFDLDNKTGELVSIVFYVNGNKKKLTCYSPKIYRSVGESQIMNYCIRLGDTFQNCEIVIPENSFSTTIKARFVNGLLHNEKGWALETAYGSGCLKDKCEDQITVKQEWYYKGKKHSYNDRPAVRYPNFTLTWYEYDCDYPYRIEKPCVIYPPSINGQENVLIAIAFNECKDPKDLFQTQKYIKPEELTDYEPNYFDYIDKQKLIDYIQYLNELSKSQQFQKYHEKIQTKVD